MADLDDVRHDMQDADANREEEDELWQAFMQYDTE